MEKVAWELIYILYRIYDLIFVRFPGIFFILPCIDAYARVDLRTRTYDVPPQEVNIFDISLNFTMHIKFEDEFG